MKKRSDQPTLFDKQQPGLPVGELPPAEQNLIALAAALGAAKVGGWSKQEELLAQNLPEAPPQQVRSTRERIEAGDDPLGEMICQLRPAEERRKQGAVYTPKAIVEWMLEQVENFGVPSRVVDPGSGSGRFLAAAGRKFPQAELIGIEIDPVPAILARGHLAALGMGGRSRILLSDYREARVERTAGKTLFIANPPYVRHHQIDPRWKGWLVTEARRLGLSASQLGGLHVHFFLATVLRAQPQDFGSFITAAEWLDVNYGSLVRELFLGGLGGTRIDVIEPTAMPFPDAASTAAITTFEVGSRPQVVTLRRVQTIEGLSDNTKEHPVRRERLETEVRWTHLTREGRKAPSGYVELGELCRVHRGTVTGANKIWIAGEHSMGLPASVLFPSVTRAKDLFDAGKVLGDASVLRKVIDLPPDLSILRGEERSAVDRFLCKARRLGGDKGYIATTRRAWWSVGLRQPAPILATYMARRPPAFVRNLADARHINVAHGLYPREPLGETILNNLIEYLLGATKFTDGRTYAGGLTKFEPREMERLLVPSPDILREGVPHDRAAPLVG
jgi:hypothetical protein